MPRKKKAKHPKAFNETNGTTEQTPGDRPVDFAKNSNVNGNKITSDELPLNQKFAKSYEESKRRQFLSNASALALDEKDESSSSSEEEDEFGELLTKGIDRKVNQTLDAIRSKDSRIYNRDIKFFEDVGDRSGDKSSASDTDDNSEDEPVAGWNAIARAAEQETPKLTLKDYVRESLLHDGRLSDDDENDDHSKVEKTNSTEQEDGLHRNTREKDHRPDFTANEGRVNLVSNESEDNEPSDDDDDAFFTKKDKTAAQLEEEARDLESFMNKRSASTSKQAGEDLLLHSYLEKETPDEKERFLRDFVLNNGWLDKNASEAPGSHDYEIEIDTNHGAKSDEDLEDENGFDEKADNFEAQYNFRFEDPDGAKIVSHTRNIPDSMRRPDTRRKRAREARKLRKDREKAEKAEEIKHLKNMKKKEIQAQLMAIQEAAGDGVDLNGLDLEGDFDPDAFNKQMEGKFNDEYYAKEDDRINQDEEEHATFGRKKQRMDSQTENVPGDVKADVERMTDAYYDLDFEDIVGGVPMRFNYKRVEPESFSMTAEDILNTDDKELNRAVSLKYFAPYISNREVQKQAWKARARQRRRATERAPDQEGNFSGSNASHDHHKNSSPGDATLQRSARRQKHRAKSPASKLDIQNSEEARVTEAPDHADLAQNTSAGPPDGDENGDTQVHDQEPSSRKKKRKRKRKSEGLSQEPMPDSRMKAYGLGS